MLQPTTFFVEFLLVLLTSAQPSSLKKHVAVKKQHVFLEEVGAVDPHVAFTLLRICGGFCKLIHLARTTHPLHIPQRPFSYLMRLYTKLG